MLPRFQQTLACLCLTIFTVTVVRCFTPSADAALIITNNLATGSGMVLRGAGGTPGAPCWLLTSTNLTWPATNWAAVATNTFDAAGNFSITSPISGVPKFYRVGIGPTNPAIANTTNAMGFATVGSGVKGGAGGTTFIVSNTSTFSTANNSTAARIIKVVGTITFTGNVALKANKTLLGVGTNATIIGDIDLTGSGVSNVIIQNLTILNPDAVGDADCITIENGAHHIWVDHCTLGESTDGQIDIVTGSDYVTVSWCKFAYTNSANNHRFSSLVGNSENNAAQDTGKLHVTYHHNWWSTLCHERMPRVRFGQVHFLNNYLSCSGNNYCARAGINSQLYIEGNYYQSVDTPYEYYSETPTGGVSTHGLINLISNVTASCTGVQSFNDSIFNPASYYSYNAQTALTARNAITNSATGAGAGTIFFP